MNGRLTPGKCHTNGLRTQKPLTVELQAPALALSHTPKASSSASFSLRMGSNTISTADLAASGMTLAAPGPASHRSQVGMPGQRRQDGVEGARPGIRKLCPPSFCFFAGMTVGHP